MPRNKKTSETDALDALPKVVIDPRAVFELWATERLMRSPATKTGFPLFFQDYAAWCRANGHEPQGGHWLGGQLLTIPMVTRRLSKGIHWYTAVTIRFDVPITAPTAS